MIFGHSLRAPGSAAPADWLASARTGEFGTVGGLVPGRHTAFARLHAPPPAEGGDDWWPSYRELFERVAEIGARHTATPETAWYAIWEGHGFDSVGTQVASREAPADDDERREREAYRRQLRDENERRTAEIRRGLAAVPRFDAPHRSYYLVTGAVADVRGLRYPSDDDWRNPDLWWPDDRSWFVATDVDCWALYVGGSVGFVAEIEAEAGTTVETVSPTDPVVTEV